MGDHPDPITLFFPGVDPGDVDLYGVLSLTSSATPDEIKKAYRRLALVHHPDKHAAASEEDKKTASIMFQQIGFAYTILSDTKRREHYDKTGRTDETTDFGAGEGGWEAYFEDLFEKVTRKKLDEMKKAYQGSAEELEDLKAAFRETRGSIKGIMERIPHSTFDDEARFIVIISDLIKEGALSSTSMWDRGINDEKGRLVRKKQADKEEREAEALAKELGVWDEFYGSGKEGARKAKGGKRKVQDEEDLTALRAVILKRQRGREDVLDGIIAKYSNESQKKDKGGGTRRKRRKA